MSRTLAYAAGVITGVLAGVFGTAMFISYAEIVSPGTCASFGKYIDEVSH